MKCLEVEGEMTDCPEKIQQHILKTYKEIYSRETSELIPPHLEGLHLNRITEEEAAFLQRSVTP